MAHIFKYFGPIRTVNQKYQEVVYAYDENGRMASETVYGNAIDGSVSSYHGYEYDDQGRIKKVSGNYGSEPIAEFGYMAWGPIKYIILGGDGSGSKGTKIEYAYHTSGGVQEIRATQLGTGKILFQQFLGYDGKANGNAKVPGNTARYSGTVTQQLYKFADDVNSLRPVRLVNYNFDELGRMLSADYQRNTAGTPLNADGSINFGAFSFENVGDNDSYMTYDLNGRITSQRTGGLTTAATYNYQSNSYKLNTVSGQLSPTNSRNMSAGGTFVYSNRGALTNDKSRDLLISYGWDLMPVLFTKNSVTNPTAYQEQYCFYDADGNRVDAIEMFMTDGLRTWSQGKHYITLGSRPYKEWTEQYSGATVTIQSTNETVNLLGASLVGRKNRGITEYYLYNHQGSLMMTVDANGNEPSNGRVVDDYLAYGDRRKIKDNGALEPITPAFTGKEYEDMTRLYYFGARFQDPELGIWLSPDPAGQYSNPYSFTGGNPINFVDAYGLWSLGLGLVIGYDKHGWHVGTGVAADADFGIVSIDVKAEHVWSTDGTQTSSANAGGGVQFGIVGLDGGAGASYNDRDGTSVNAHVGANVVGVGAEVGTNQAWDRGGNYLGGNVYGEGYLGIKGLASYGGGYEGGWGGFRSGFYQNATFAMQNWSDHGNGWGYDGFEQNFSVYSHTFASNNHAELMTDPTLAGGNGHNSIKGAFNGEDFDISVGTDADVNQVLMGSNSTLTGQSATTGIPVSLSGLSIGKLNQFSKAMHMVRDAGLLPYNVLALNCGFYTTAAMAFAGRPSYYLVQPNLMAAEARFLGGRGL